MTNSLSKSVSVNPELKRLFDEDQLSRRGTTLKDYENVDWGAVARQDEIRKQQTQLILDNGEAHSALDYKHAAMIFQHGSTSADFLRANQLAQKSVGQDPSDPQARNLVACSWDRYQWSLGNPQVYGTQMQKTGDSYTLEPFDPAAVTDEDRQALGIKTLAEIYQELATINEQAREI